MKGSHALFSVLAASLLLALLGCRSRGGAAPKYDTVKAERGKLVAKVTATGTVSALVTVQVGSQVSGRILEILVDFNTRVEKGQVVARIDPQLFEAAVEQARANFMAAQSNLAKAKVQAEDAERQKRRAAKLLEQTVGAQADYDTAEAGARQAQAQVTSVEAAVEQARASLHQTEVNLGYTTILSPISGVVISRNVDVGQTVAASLSSPTLFTIAEDLGHMQVDTNVAESDIGRIAPEMESSFTVDAYPGEKFHGKVRQVRNSPITQQNVVTYDAVIDVANEELKLKPGMTANVTFVWARRDDVITIPNASLRFRLPQGPEVPTGSAGDTKRHEGAGAGSKADGGKVGGGDPTKREGRGEGWKGGGEGWKGGGAEGSEGGFRHGRGRDDGASSTRTIYVLKGGKPAPVEVKIGITDGSRTEVLEGEVTEGTEVVTSVSESGAMPRPGGPGGFGRPF